MNYRHERKHEITYGDMLCLRGRLNAVAHADAHGDHGKYHIRSLYFDNLYDKAFMEKINGVNCREKYRLRYYDGDTSVIHLEKKSKINCLSCKQSVQVTAEQVTQILRGDVAWLQESEEPLLREFYTKLVNQGLRPKTIVDYTREAFTYAPGNVRVTMDYDIRTGMYGLDFLNAECVMLPIIENHRILEVKWDAYLPDCIRSAVQLGNQGTQSFSKYAACRAYEYAG